MKKLLLLILTLGLFSFSTISSEKIETKTSVKKTEKTEKTVSSDCKYGQCEATAKSTGKRCLHCVSEKGDSYCWQHK